MNKPAYILVEEFGKVVSEVKAALNLPNLNYLYGYLSEVKETLAQDSKAGGAFAQSKYPLVWLVQPFTIDRNLPGYYGQTKLQFFIINGSQMNWKADQRMANNYVPIIYPIYEEMFTQLRRASNVFEGLEIDTHSVTDRYYWGEEQRQAIDDTFDCREVNNLSLKIQDKKNC